MHRPDEFDRQFVLQRAAQFREQLERWQRGELSDDAFRPLRLQNGWYVQRHAPMLRVAIPYGVLSSAQARALAHVARTFDQPQPALFAQAQATQAALGQVAPRGRAAVGSRLAHGLVHFTTRQNAQFNWIPLARAADAMDALAAAGLHGIQTSGNCIRNITSDALAGIAVDEVADPRPYAELLRQWSTLHPEFGALPRKFKVAIHGAAEDRAAIGWHDLGLQLVRDADGALGFRVFAGGGMGRTPVVAPELFAFVPRAQILNALTAVLRVYNAWGRRDNLYKARLKILVRAEGERFRAEVDDEYRRIVADGGWHTVPEAEFARLQAAFEMPPLPAPASAPHERSVEATEGARFERWRARNVEPHRRPERRAVTLSLKRAGSAPGDAGADALDAAAALAERFSNGELRVTHSQNLLLPWVHVDDLPALWRAAAAHGFATPNLGRLTDLIACPGGDYCDLANARSLPLAQLVAERYTDLDELDDLGDIDLHISGCINSCGHHHSGHIGILGVDKDGQEWYQISLGGSDGARASGPATPGRIVGPSFAAAEVPEALDAILDVYRRERAAGEAFVDAVRRLGLAPFRAAADAVRVVTARPDAPAARATGTAAPAHPATREPACD